MKRRTLLERVGAVTTTGVLAGCLDEGSVGNGDGPGAGGDDGNGQDGADGNGSSNDTDGNGGGNETGGNETRDDANDSDGADGGSTDESDEDAADGSNGTDGSDGANESDDEAAGSKEEEDDAENASKADDGSDASISRERSSIETTNADCLEGDDHHRAVVEVGEDAVTVAGHLEAPNPCHEAVLEDVSTQDGAVVIEVGLESEVGVCTECVGRIEYEATVALEGGTPDNVVVYHRGSDGRTEVETDARE